MAADGNGPHPPVTPSLTINPCPQEVTQDPRKVPFLFEHLFTEVADPRHEQAKVMFLIASEQYKVQHKNMTAASRAQEGKRIYSKFFDPRKCASSLIYFLCARTLILKKIWHFARSLCVCVCVCRFAVRRERRRGARGGGGAQGPVLALPVILLLLFI